MEISQEAFCAWLCQREHEQVGRPGSYFHSPLALWLSEVGGHVYGVDERAYGRASWEYESWLPLPQWAQVFTACSERFLTAAMRGQEAFTLLAQVELLLSPLRSTALAVGASYGALRGRHGPEGPVPSGGV